MVLKKELIFVLPDKPLPAFPKFFYFHWGKKKEMEKKKKAI